MVKVSQFTHLKKYCFLFVRELPLQVEFNLSTLFSFLFLPLFLSILAPEILELSAPPTSKPIPNGVGA